MKDTAKVQARLQSQQAAELDDAASRMGLNSSALVRALIEAFLDAMRRDGAVIMPIRIAGLRETAACQSPPGRPDAAPAVPRGLPLPSPSRRRG